MAVFTSNMAVFASNVTVFALNMTVFAENMIVFAPNATIFAPNLHRDQIGNFKEDKLMSNMIFRNVKFFLFCV